MTPPFDFDAAFEALAGNPPFGWQRRLFEEWLSAGRLPSAVDIPTGLGKTAVMAVWLLARAAGADLPRRLVYVVDRRAVVDQATRFAKQLRDKISDELAARLGLDDGATALPISTLRGGFAGNRDWLENPVKPAVVVGTVDMIGSRLLFEGYGVSRNMRPFHAGFLGVDTLVLLDEAHLCPPFEVLLRRIADRGGGSLGPVPGEGPSAPPFHLISLSATGRDMPGTPSESIFRLEDRDREEAVVRERLTARKRLGVIEPADAQSLAERMAGRAIELGDDAPCRVVVYCHRRKDAIEVKAQIDGEAKRRKKTGELAVDWKSELLVGERRVHERAKLEVWLECNGFLGDTKAMPEAPTFLVATSAGEVGVDLDADHMVCDLVAWERMVQRLGRVNRRGGKDRTAIVDVFAPPPDPKANPRKAAKEESGGELCEHRRQMAPLTRLPRGDDGRCEAGPDAIVALKRDCPNVLNEATTPAPLYPELTRPLVDAWAMTSLKEHTGRPEVAPWLRGWEEEDDPQTEVVWRKHVPHVRGNDGVSLPSAMVAEFFQSAPVHATERLEAQSSRVFDWLLKRTVQADKRDRNHELAIEDDDIVAVLMDRSGGHRENASFRKIRNLAAPVGSLSRSERRNRDREKREWRERLLPGALLVVDARIGGLRDGMLDEKCESEAVTADADEEWRGIFVELSRPQIGFRVEVVDSDEHGEGLKTPDGDENWRHVRTFETRLNTGGVAQHGLVVFKWHDDAADEDQWSILSAPQTLADHAEEAAARACDLATRLGLPNEEIEALSIAARLHDDGKASDRWQNAMNAPDKDGPYAKTSGGGNWRLLEGYRHEFGSLLRAEQASLPERTRDLILHLIAAHHGNARPLIGSAGCEDGPPSLLEARAGEAALRFARLQKRYGPWGLAWREAILRAADQSVSREWSLRHSKHPGRKHVDG